MTGGEKNEIAEVRERLARVETRLAAIEEMREDVKSIRDTLATAKGWRLGFMTAIPALGGGGVGAAIMKWLGSGGPTGTH